jgi:predicted ATPase
LFIEELVQSLKQGDQLQDTPEGTILTQEPKNIPPTIHSLLTARLDRLPNAIKQFAYMLSVVGMESPEALLSCLVNAPDELAAYLAELHRQGVLTMQRRGQQVYYRFAHTLLQEVAYNALLRSERQVHHLRVAQALESLYLDHQADYAEILAYHYTRSAQSESAIPYLLKSAERAQAVSAVQEALHYLQNAGTILETLDRSPAYMQYRFEVLFHQERLYDILGSREQQQALIDQLLTLLQSSKDQARLADVYVRQGDLYTELARFEAAEQVLKEALHLRRTLSDPVGESQVLRSLGFLRWHQGQYDEALTHNEATLTLDRQRDDHMTIATDLTNLAAVLRSLGDHERALTSLQEALDIYEAAQHPTKQAFTLYSMANIHREERTHERALTQYQQAYDIFITHQDRLMASRALAGIASIRWEQGDTQDSLRLA